MTPRTPPRLLEQRARDAVTSLRDFARMHGMDHRQRDPLVMAIHDAIDALSTALAEAQQQNQWFEKRVAWWSEENARLRAALEGAVGDLTLIAANKPVIWRENGSHVYGDAATVCRILEAALRGEGGTE